MLPLVAGLSACGIGGWLVRGEPVEVVEVARAQVCTAEDEATRVTLFATPDAVAGWEQRTGISLQRAGGFDPGRYALVEMGQRHTGGYGVAASREARLSGDVLRLYVTFFSPGPGAMTTQMITSPCVLVRLPDGAYRTVEIYDQSGRLRAASEPAG